MTLKELFDHLGNNPIIIIAYFFFIPLMAFITNALWNKKGKRSPAKYIYASLIYLVTVPGIFAVTLNIYLFIFERQSIFAMDIYTQLIPIVSMIITLGVIIRNVSLDDVPGFDKIGSLVFIIGTTLCLMWFIDRTRIYMISFLRFEYVLVMLVGLIMTMHMGWKNLLNKY